ncbi:MAG: hypothetical protein ACK5JH_05700 [Anaerocolumna sp.]
MYKEMNQKIASLYQQMNNLKKTDDLIRDLKIQLSDLSRKENSLAVTLDLELEDVDRINQKNLTSFVYTLLGSREEKEQKEREEAIIAQKNLDDVKDQIEKITYQLSVLQTEKRNLLASEQEYNRLFSQKLDMLKAGNTTSAQRVHVFEANILKGESNIKELNEAISSGRNVLNRLKEVESSLNSAKSWGTWDMLGGGMISDMAKHSHIDEAKSSMSDVQNLLKDFHSELADINITSSLVLNIDGFSTFADFFFDGIFADWNVQSRINESLDSVTQLDDRMNEILERLRQMISKEDNSIIDLKEKLRVFVSEAL